MEQYKSIIIFELISPHERQAFKMFVVHVSISIEGT